MEAQAPICPFCGDDHSSNSECDEQELKKRMLKAEFNYLMESYEPKHEKHDGGLVERFNFKYTEPGMFETQDGEYVKYSAYEELKKQNDTSYRGR